MSITILKPAGQSKATNNPYYREKFAIELRAFIEDMLVSGDDIIFSYKDFPDLGKHSLYLKLNQSLRYLIDNLDSNPPDRYKEFRNMVIITREKTGVRFSFSRKSSASLIATKVVAKENTIHWKDGMEKFIETSKIGEIFKQENLSLSEDDINDIKQSILGATNFVLDIAQDHIKILHVTPDV